MRKNIDQTTQELPTVADDETRTQPEPTADPDWIEEAGIEMLNDPYWTAVAFEAPSPLDSARQRALYEQGVRLAFATRLQAISAEVAVDAIAPRTRKLSEWLLYVSELVSAFEYSCSSQIASLAPAPRPFTKA